MPQFDLPEVGPVEQVTDEAVKVNGHYYHCHALTVADVERRIRYYSDMLAEAVALRGFFTKRETSDDALGEAAYLAFYQSAGGAGRTPHDWRNLYPEAKGMWVAAAKGAVDAA